MVWYYIQLYENNISEFDKGVIMIISERIIKVLKERNMTQVEFAKQIGISTSTISEWKKRKTNPTADKIMDICNVLQITPEQLLTGKGIEDEEEIAASSPESKFTHLDIQIIEDFHRLKEEQQKRLIAYMEALKKIESLEDI
ncbi:DNA-binding transcriptional regulator, XRE-family HTH domain [Lachnospiraceae bacterium]|nr:DNA-binding transcriptional regulator, XRE-family HTH domain [Lachnospiraceae bacterium]